ncbi:hypothetical protein FNH13_01850 [Ornithinimicrobium ciconiae]|uniref:Uncharacterized protein n=1 Tax=Ornithinimicrobium ciconiae TaxID=2594265 RepID=A0A516G6S5_9MICO|nr:hypothetical protein [Ornithinimicrobium ciconiae]QDO87224.1 hypothetical protein FNH13_01850 [Ornithinimicrobium ciconiae]
MRTHDLPDPPRPVRVGSPELPGITVDDSACDPNDLSPCGAVAVTVTGDVDWQTLVTAAVTQGWPGLETLAGVTGDVADVVRVNPSEHGQTLSDVVAAVRTWDRHHDAQRTFAWSDCDFRSGGSRFVETLPDGSYRYQVLDVSLLFKQGELSAPIATAHLATLLGTTRGARVPLVEVRDALVAGAAEEAPRRPLCNGV